MIHRAAIGLAACSVGSLLAGCSGGSAARPAPTVSLSAADFAAAPGAAPAPAAPSTTEQPARIADARPIAAAPLDINGTGDLTGDRPVAGASGAAAAPDAGAPFVGVAGAPDLSGADVPPAGAAVLVDAKIGDVNGNPIYASTFFDVGSATLEPLGPRLASEARRRGPQDWLVFARDEINLRLDLLVRDELLRGEALASIDPQRRQNLFAFVRSLQEQERRVAGGSTEALSREIQEREGLSLDQWARRQEQEQLIRMHVYEKIQRRINISWRDIDQAYNGRFADIYQHPPRYRFFLINVPASAAEDRASVETALASGQEFEELAALPVNRFRNGRGGLEVRELTGELANASFFPSPVLNDAAKTMSPGDTRGPLDLGGVLAWIHLDAVELPPGLYEAQLDVESRLQVQRFNELTARYLEKLIGRSSMTSIVEMRARLLGIAVERYKPEAAPRTR
ncbi:MAG: peptidylprolyl isomerase [Planctomycetota bacterium]|nr:peptidylprolyl isomerase [Planctomycetota bacterium]